MALVVYQYPNCSTCKKALTWLRAHALAFESIDLVASPPSAVVLERAATLAGLPVRKLFNVSGVSYRAGGFQTKLATMTDAQALAALAADGKLIKRPLVVGPRIALVGFDPDAWRATLTG